MRMFFIYKDQMIVGPIGEKDLEKMVATKALSPEAQCREGMHGKWQTVGDYLALSQPQQAENAPAAQPEAPAGNAPRLRLRRQAPLRSSRRRPCLSARSCGRWQAGNASLNARLAGRSIP